MTFWQKHTGEIIAGLVLLSWAISLWLLLHLKVNFYSPLPYVLLLVQTHLYTGLFITAHDAMHGVVSRHRKVNVFIGALAAGLFAYNNFNRLLPKHHAHHHHVATSEDPDYHSGNFFAWYFNFLKNYITWQQLVLMAITFNLLKLVFPPENVILFWMIPAILATFQLFYFGTYLPHRGEHAPDNKHKAHTQGKNHAWAFISCYFFGYHYEHHDKPYVPWWLLYKEKN